MAGDGPTMRHRLLRAAASVVGLLALAGVTGTLVDVALLALDAPVGVAGPVSTAVAVTVVLPVADAYTPLGRDVRTDTLRRAGRARLALELLLAAGAAFVAGGALAAAGLRLHAVFGTFVVVVLGGVAAGYGSFVLRNREFYADA